MFLQKQPWRQKRFGRFFGQYVCFCFVTMCMWKVYQNGTVFSQQEPRKGENYNTCPLKSQFFWIYFGFFPHLKCFGLVNCNNAWLIKRGICPMIQWVSIKRASFFISVVGKKQQGFKMFLRKQPTRQIRFGRQFRQNVC